jgi:hypothetical protein
MADPRSVDFRAEQQLRTRTLGMLGSHAAARVQFMHYSGIPFDGGAFAAVSLAIRNQLIGFQAGGLPGNAAFFYDLGENLIQVPTYAFGQDNFGRYGLINACVQAYFDIMSKDTNRLWQDSIALIAGALFSLYYERPGAAPTVPSWASNGFHSEVFRVALPLYGKAFPFVSPLDCSRLETVVLAVTPNGSRTSIARNNGV